MRFLIDAGLPRQTKSVLESLGHEAVDVRDVGLACSDEAISEYARAHGLCLLTRDGDFGDLRVYPAERFAGIVIFKLDDWRREAILAVVAAFASSQAVLPLLAGRLAIVSGDRVRLRPAPPQSPETGK